MGISNTERLGEIQRAAIPSANTRPSTLTAGLLNRENAETVAPGVKAANWADGVPIPVLN